MINKGELIDNRYKIVSSIGEGGMANVYLAWDTILEREVAVKILRGDLADDEKFVRRFQREANSASSLKHPNIVEMYDVGEDNGRYFIVMEYVNGKTLKSLIKKRGALNLNEAVDIMLQLTSGIACAHDSYIIHRDIKPQNIMILEDGRVKITDFGIAMALNQNELTQTNSVMGSVHYLPPEQASGSGCTIKSDIYSLGILMFELFTGHVPFKGDNAVEIAIKHMKDPIPSVCSENPNIPQSIENIILKACAKNPKNRYDSVYEMYNDLKVALEPEHADDLRVTYRYPEHSLDEDKKVEKLENSVVEAENENDETIVDKGDNRINTALIIVGIVCIVIVLIGLVFILLFTSKTVKDVRVPDVKGLTESAACKKLEKVKLVCSVENDYDPEVEPGVVITTEPSANANIKETQKVKIYVNSNENTFEVEDYTGKNVEAVALELEGYGIKVVKTPKKVTKEDKKEENTIIGQSKEAGTRLKKDTTNSVIELEYAVLVTVYPDFMDGTYNRDLIEQFCTDNKITCTFKEELDNNYKEGAIILQSRDAGEEVKIGTTLIITIATNTKETPKPDTNTDDNQEG